MNPEHQALEEEGGDLAAQLVPHRIGDTNPSAHLRLQVADWERRCVLAGVDGNMEERLEKNIDAIRALFFQQLDAAYQRSQLGAIRSGRLGGLFSAGDMPVGGLGLSEYRIPDPMDSFREIEISSYPREIRVEMASRTGPSDLLRMMGMPELAMQSQGRSMRESVWPKTEEVLSMGHRIGITEAMMEHISPPDGLNRKQRRAQAAQARKPEPQNVGDIYVRGEGEAEFRKLPYTVSNLKWTPL